MRTIFNKHKFIKVYCYNENKTITLKYFKISKFNPAYLVNSNHIFNSNGYQAILITDKSAETINPLDFTSKFNQKDFKTAIESKVIKDTLGTLKGDKIDLVKVMLFANIFITLILLFILMKNNGVV